MEKRIDFRLIGLSILCFFVISCSDDNNGKMNITVCGQTNPEWILRNIENVSQDYFTTVSVYHLSKDSREYIALNAQPAHSSRFPHSLKLYTCPDGEEISDEEEIIMLYESFSTNEFELIWSKVYIAE